jgi:hypothetical protein
MKKMLLTMALLLLGSERLAAQFMPEVLPRSGYYCGGWFVGGGRACSVVRPATPFKLDSKSAS